MAAKRQVREDLTDKVAAPVDASTDAAPPRIVTIVVHGAAELADQPEKLKLMLLALPEADRAMARVFVTSAPLDLSGGAKIDLA